MTAAAAKRETRAAIDRIVHYAGWSDKYGALLSSVNPVAPSYFDFSPLEPTGVVGTVAPEKPALLGLVSHVLPVIVSGNTCVVLLSEREPLPGLEWAEVHATSDLPGGVINLQGLDPIRAFVETKTTWHPVGWQRALVDRRRRVAARGVDPELSRG